MSTTTRKPLIEPAEIPLGRLFRPSDNQTRRMVEAGIFPGNSAIPFHPLDLDRYHKLVEEEILGKDDRLELLGGWLVTKMSINPPHQTSLRKVRWEFKPNRSSRMVRGSGLPGFPADFRLLTRA